MENADDEKIPRSFIFQRGDIGKKTKLLLKNLKTVMNPYTASNLKVLLKLLNNIKKGN